VHDTKYPRVAYPSQPRIVVFENPKMLELRRNPARRGKNWSLRREKPAARGADHTSAPKARRQLLVTRQGADRIQLPVPVGRPDPIADRCLQRQQPSRLPTAVVPVPWSELVGLIELDAPRGKTGRPPFAVATMPRVHFMPSGIASPRGNTTALCATSGAMRSNGHSADSRASGASSGASCSST
jgi:hypothetical protein